MECQYCGNQAKLTTGEEVYKSEKYADKNFWLCDCGAYVGCHKGTDTPFGTLANKATRIKRMEAHEVFDYLWKQKLMTRNAAYKWAQKEIRRDFHIGNSTQAECNLLIQKVNQKLKKREKRKAYKNRRSA